MLRCSIVSLLALGMSSTAPALGQTIGWTQLEPASGPVARLNHAMAYDTAREVSVLFGGIAGFSTSIEFDDTWEWDGTHWTQRQVSGPSARHVHAMAFDSVRGVMVLYGGYTPRAFADSDTWEWDGATWTQRIVSGPGGRSSHAMAYDSARGVTVLFGGDSFQQGNGGTWEWDGNTWTQRTTDGPSRRIETAMAFDSSRGVVVLFGGRSQTGLVLGDTWEWDGTAWTQRATDGPPARSSHAMVFDSARSKTVLFGGYIDNGSNLGDTWEWDGTAWIQQSITGPRPRVGHAMAFDAIHQRAVLFGGASQGLGYLNDTWVFGTECAAPAITTQPADTAACMGTPATISLEASGTGPLTFQWRRAGTPIDPSNTHFSGIDSPTLTIASVQIADQVAYDCVLTNTCGPNATTIVSDSAALSCRPIIQQQPPAASFIADGLQLSVGVPDCGAYTYRWRYNGQLLFNIRGLFSGVTTRTLTIISADPSVVGVFDCVLTSPCGTTTTDPAGVYCAGDFNRDFVVNADDLGDFITGYFNDPANPQTDFNGDGIINADDLGDFITAYFNGC